MQLNSERLVQALIRLAVTFVLAGIAAVIPMLSILSESVSDPVLATVVIAVATAVLQAIAKYLGGPTEPVQPMLGAGATGSSRRRPSIWSI
jgi:hypothetical protein